MLLYMDHQLFNKYHYLHNIMMYVSDYTLNILYSNYTYIAVIVLKYLKYLFLENYKINGDQILKFMMELSA